MKHFNNHISRCLSICILLGLLTAVNLEIQCQTDLSLQLLTAAYSGDLAAVDSILLEGADPNAMSEDGVTALMYAAQFDNPSLIIRLLDAGALPDKKGEYWPSALYTAASNGYEEISGILLAAGADPDNPDHAGSTALMAACTYNDFRIAWMLLEAGANPNQQDKDGNSPLHYAARAGSYECAALLLSRHSFPSPSNQYGNTPLLFAAKNNDIAMGELLMQHDSETWKRNNNNMSAASIAALHKQQAFIRFLLLRQDSINQLEIAALKDAKALDSSIHQRNLQASLSGWAEVNKLALKAGDKKLYKIIKRATGLTYPKPVVYAYKFGLKTLFNSETHLEGCYLGIQEAHTSLGLGLSWLFRLKPDKQIIDIPGGTFQFREYRNVILFHIDKAIPIFDYHNWRSFIHPEIAAGYSWGSYRGALIQPKETVPWYAGLDYTWQVHPMHGTIGYRYYPTLPGGQSPHLLSVSIGFNINTFNHKKFRQLT